MHPRNALPVAILALIMGSCSQAADPEEVAELAKTFSEDAHELGIPETENQRKCRARLYLESDLSNEAIDAIKSGEPPAPKTRKDIEILRDLADKIAEQCLSPDPQP